MLFFRNAKAFIFLILPFTAPLMGGNANVEIYLHGGDWEFEAQGTIWDGDSYITSSWNSFELDVPSSHNYRWGINFWGGSCAFCITGQWVNAGHAVYKVTQGEFSFYLDLQDVNINYAWHVDTELRVAGDGFEIRNFGSGTNECFGGSWTTIGDNSTLYLWTVLDECKDSWGLSGYEGSPNTDEFQPTAPQNLTAVIPGIIGEHPELSWNAPADPTNSNIKYKLHRKINFGSYYELPDTISSTSFEDESYTFGYTDNALKYKATAISGDGNLESTFSNVINLVIAKRMPATTVIAPERYNLAHAFPNPFNPSTTIRYALPEESTVRLSVFDIRGNIVSELISESQSPGTYETPWEAKDMNAAQLPTGVYIYRLEAVGLESGERFSQTEKMVYLK